MKDGERRREGEEMSPSGTQTTAGSRPGHVTGATRDIVRRHNKPSPVFPRVLSLSLSKEKKKKKEKEERREEKREIYDRIRSDRTDSPSIWGYV